MSNSVQTHRWQPTRLPHPWDSPGENTGVGCHFLLQCMKVKSESEVAQSCLTLSDSMDCSLPGSSVHGIFQARVLEWVAIAFSESMSIRCSKFCLNKLLWGHKIAYQSPIYHIFKISQSKRLHHFQWSIGSHQLSIIFLNSISSIKEYCA